MSFLLLVYRSLVQHRLASIVTILALALATGLMLAVWTLRDAATRTFVGMDGGFDAVLGARGSRLQLVLNAVFHLEASPGNLKAEDYLYLKNQPMVETALPLAIGDNFEGWRLVGTEPALVARHPLAQGRMFSPLAHEAVAGAFAARKLGWRIGTTFSPYHGLDFDESHQHEEIYTVTGILEPTNTPADRVIWIPLAGIQTMGGHDPALAGDVSAVLVKLKENAPTAGFRLDLMYNRQGDRLTFAWPIGAILSDFFQRIGWFEKVLAVLAWLVALLASSTVLVGLYNTLNERKRDLAILRCLGAGKRTLFGLMLAEACAIGLGGIAGGCLVYLAIMASVSAIVQETTGVVLPLFTAHPALWQTPLIMLGMCLLAGLLPAWKAYRLPVAEGLKPSS